MESTKTQVGKCFTIKSIFQRSLALILALVLLIPVSAGTASAESTDNDASFLDIFELYPTYQRTQVITGGESSCHYFPLPSLSRVFSVEVYIFYNGPGTPQLYISNGVSSNAYWMQCVQMSNNLYKFNGNVSLSGWWRIDSIFSFPDLAEGEKAYFTFLDFKVNYLNKEEFTTPISYFATVDGELYYEDESSLGYIIPDNIASSGSYFQAEISVPVLRTIDAFYFLIHSGFIHISSIDCKYPVDFDLINTDPDPNTQNYISSILRVELPESYRDDYIKVYVTGTAYPGAYFQANNCFGIVRTDPPSTLFVWLEKINSSISSIPNQMASAIAAAFKDVSLKFSIDLGFSETIDSLSNFISTSFDGIKTTISTTGNTLENVSTTLTSNIKSLMTTLTANVESLMTTLTANVESLMTSLTGNFESLTNSLISNVRSLMNTLVSNVESLINTLVDNVESLMNTLTSDIDRLITSYTNNLNSFLNNLIGSFTTAIDDVVDILKDFFRIEKKQEDAADSFLDDSDNQAGDLNEVIDSMQTPKPNMGGIDTSLDGISGGSEFTIFNTAILTLSSGDIVTRLLLVAVSLMLVSYVFFGKKG